MTAALQRYALAYQDLDVGAARDVWPTVDQRALARAFQTLEYQSFTFDECNVNVEARTASADCRGWVTYVPRIGSKDPRTVARRWSFALQKPADVWQITQATMR